jgi:hypothetical protein
MPDRTLSGNSVQSDYISSITSRPTSPHNRLFVVFETFKADIRGQLGLHMPGRHSCIDSGVCIGPAGSSDVAQQSSSNGSPHVEK